MNKKRLYESIMRNVAKEVKKALNESYIENKLFDDLTNKYMPDCDNADTLAGELLRAANRIEYRFYNDGDFAGEGYGNETVNPAVRFLYDKHNEMPIPLRNVVSYFMDCVDAHYVSSKQEYESNLNDLKQLLADYIIENQLWTVENDEDMFSYIDEKEDVDTSWEDDEEEDYFDEDDEEEDYFDEDDEEEDYFDEDE